MIKKKDVKKKVLTAFIIVCTGLISASLLFITACRPVEKPLDGVITLRSEFKAVSEAEMKSILKKYGFFDKRWNKYRSFPNKFELKKIGDQKIVIDHATGLVWHQSGSPTPLTYQEAKEWIADLNRKGYGGYSNWRLPTLEEAASLLESRRIDKRYIDPVFSPVQLSMRSSDIYNEVRSWGVSFHYGGVFKVGIIEPDYVKPVTKYQ